jgi:hypothetical protein
MALLAAILISEDEKLESIPREKLLAAADGVLAAIRAMTINADARLTIEAALAQLVA